MKIAILGTRGIPNNYGGFEEFAESLSNYLSCIGHEATVYCISSAKIISTTIHKGTQLIHIPHFKNNGGMAMLIYDYKCLKHALKCDYDLIIECGYTFAPLMLLFSRYNPSKFIVLMDGIEWQRTKWGLLAKIFIRLSERYCVKKFSHLLADHPCIADYYFNKYKRKFLYIPFGVNEPEMNRNSFFNDLNFKSNDFFMMICRIEPENNVEMVLEGFMLSKSTKQFIVVGALDTKYARKIVSRYSNPSIHFLGSIYDKLKLDTLRSNAAFYFHGHSVGGTNPSLLQAMICGVSIASHENPYSKHLLGTDAQYFSSSTMVSQIIQNSSQNVSDSTHGALRLQEKCRAQFKQEIVLDRYVDYLEQINKSLNIQ